MSTALQAIGALVVLSSITYVALALTLGHEGRRLVDRFARAPRVVASGDEERIYVRRSRRRGWARRGALAYERPLDVAELPAALPDDGVLPPPRQVEGRNGEM